VSSNPLKVSSPGRAPRPPSCGGPARPAWLPRRAPRGPGSPLALLASQRPASRFPGAPDLQAAAEVAALLLLARSIEPVYGSTEFLRLVGVLDLSGALATFFSVYVYYLASSAKTGKVL